MPYTIIQQDDGSYSVFHKDRHGKQTGSAVGTGHASREAAQRQVQAIYSHESGKSAHMKLDNIGYGPLTPQGAQIAAQNLLKIYAATPINPSGDPKFDEIFKQFLRICDTYKPLWEKIANGVINPSRAAGSCAQAARRMRSACQMMEGAHNRQYARAVTMYMNAEHVAQAAAASGGKSVPAKRYRGRKMIMQMRTQSDLYRLNVAQLQRELKGLVTIQRTAENAANFCNAAIRALAQANNMLPEDDLLGKQIQALSLAGKLLERHENLKPYIQQVKTALAHKQEQAKIPGQLDKLRQGANQPQQPPKRPGLFGRLGFGRGK